MHTSQLQFLISFLDLLVSQPDAMPTLDIDLVWHTHQLMAIKYQNDCKEFFGRYIDQSVLANSFPCGMLQL